MRKEKKFVTILTDMLIRHSLIRLCFILGFIVLIYYVLNQTFIRHVFVNQERHMLNAIQSEIKHEVREINYKMSEIVKKALLLQNEHENLFENQEEYGLEGFDPVFEIHENGALYKLEDNGGSALYYSQTTAMTEETLHKALLTEWMDLSFKSLTDNDPLVVQVYFNSHDSMNRIYPFIEELPNIYGPAAVVENYNFYYLADEKHNPDRKAVWTTAYLDPANRGWMVSCIVPIYNGDFLEGVTGLDITIEKIVEQILNVDLAVDSHVFFVDERGMIIAMDANMEKLLQLTELKQAAYETTVQDTVIKPDKYNIHQHPDEKIRGKLAAIFKGEDDEVKEVEFNGIDYYFNKMTVANTGWTMVVLTERELLLESAEILKDELKNVVQIIIATIILAVVFSAMISRRRIKDFSQKVSMPLKELSEQAEKFGIGTLDIPVKTPTGITEIDTLNNNFYEMAREIKRRTDELFETHMKKREAELKMKNYVVKATTDPLTQVYNRRKIDDVMKVEIDRCRRYGSVFSIIFLDIDFFKEINDEHGHQVGDEILVSLSQVLKGCVRSSDVVARWGGDEFMVLAIETNEENTYHMAEKIRKMVLEYEFSHNQQVSTSIGVAEVDISQDNVRTLLHKADMALYEAKNQGKNRAVRYSEIRNKRELDKIVKERV